MHAAVPFVFEARAKSLLNSTAFAFSRGRNSGAFCSVCCCLFAGRGKTTLLDSAALAFSGDRNYAV